MERISFRHKYLAGTGGLFFTSYIDLYGIFTYRFNILQEEEWCNRIVSPITPFTLCPELLRDNLLDMSDCNCVSGFICFCKLRGVCLVHHTLLSLQPHSSDAVSEFMYIHILNNFFLPPHLSKFYSQCSTVLFGTCPMKALSFSIYLLSFWGIWPLQSWHFRPDAFWWQQ